MAKLCAQPLPFLPESLELPPQGPCVALEEPPQAAAGWGLSPKEPPLGLQEFVLLLQEAHLRMGNGAPKPAKITPGGKGVRSTPTPQNHPKITHTPRLPQNNPPTDAKITPKPLPHPKITLGGKQGRGTPIPENHPKITSTPKSHLGKGGKGSQNPKITAKSALGEWVGLEGAMKWKGGGRWRFAVPGQGGVCVSLGGVRRGSGCP